MELFKAIKLSRFGQAGFLDEQGRFVFADMSDGCLQILLQNKYPLNPKKYWARKSVADYYEVVDWEPIAPKENS